MDKTVRRKVTCYNQTMSKVDIAPEVRFVCHNFVSDNYGLRPGLYIGPVYYNFAGVRDNYNCPALALKSDFELLVSFEGVLMFLPDRCVLPGFVAGQEESSLHHKREVDERVSDTHSEL